MPYYEYRCQTCSRPARLFFSYKEYDSADPACPHCGQKTLRRRIRRVALAKSDDNRMDSMLDDEQTLSALENEDPRALGRLMRQMSAEMGEGLDDDMHEVIDRLERGQSPDEIEQAMPDLAADDAGGGMGGGFDDF